MIDWFEDRGQWENKYDFSYSQDMTLMLNASNEEMEILNQNLNKKLTDQELAIINKYLPDYKW